MERLWAPWRMEYVVRPLPQEGCLFCRAFCEQDAWGVLLRITRGLVMLNAYPYNSGHLLIVPASHVPSLTRLDSEELGLLAHLTKAAMLALERTLRPAGFNVGVNVGRAGGAGIAEHVHVHVVPRWEGDTNFMSVLADTRVVPEALQACAQRVQPALVQVAHELGLLTDLPEVG